MPLFQEHYRDKKLKQLYQTLTRSDFAGDFEDDYVLSVLYAMRCIDCHQSPSLPPIRICTLSSLYSVQRQDLRSAAFE